MSWLNILAVTAAAIVCCALAVIFGYGLGWGVGSLLNAAAKAIGG